MTHFEKIAENLKDRGLDAMLITSDPGEFYAMGFHGEGAALITPDKTWYYTDSRYIEAANQIIDRAEVIMWTAGNGFRKQIAGLVKKEQSCREIVQEIMTEAEALLDRAGSKWK